MAGRNLSLQFGLVTLSVKSDGAVEKAAPMSNMCVGQPDKPEHPATPVTAPKVCTACGPITDYDALVKGVKQGKAYTIVSQDDVAEAKAEFSAEHKGVLNLIPHPAQQFLGETAPGDTLHFLTPADAASANHYQLLVKLIESHPEYAFASLYTPVSATALYMVRVREGVLVMEKRTRSQAMKPTPSVGGEVNDALYAMLEAVLPTFATDYDPTDYEDKFQAALDAMLESAEQVTVGAVDVKKAAPIVHTDDDLLAKLQALASVAA